MTKTELTKVIKHYTDNKDFETAKNHVLSFGPQLKNYDIESELKKIDELSKKEIKDVKLEKED